MITPKYKKKSLAVVFEFILIKLYFKGLKNMILSKLPNLKNYDKIPIIITCPAYFHDLQRTQLKRAVEKSGFDIFKLINVLGITITFALEQSKYSKFIKWSGISVTSE